MKGPERWSRVSGRSPIVIAQNCPFIVGNLNVTLHRFRSLNKFSKIASICYD